MVLTLVQGQQNVNTYYKVVVETYIEKWHDQMDIPIVNYMFNKYPIYCFNYTVSTIRESSNT